MVIIGFRPAVAKPGNQIWAGFSAAESATLTTVPFMREFAGRFRVSQAKCSWRKSIFTVWKNLSIRLLAWTGDIEFLLAAAFSSQFPGLTLVSLQGYDA
jgi:hypothetical protein